MSPLAAENVPAPRPSRLTPSLAPLVESTSSNDRAAPAVPVTSTAGPPVRLRWAVAPAGRVIGRGLLGTNAAVAPDVVGSDRSRTVGVPVVPDMLTRPLPGPVTVSASNVLVRMRVPVADRPA